MIETSVMKEFKNTINHYFLNCFYKRLLLVGLHVFKPSDAFDKVSLSPIQQDFSPVTNFKYWNSNKYNCRNNHRQSSKCNTAKDKQHKDTGATKINK